MINLIKKHIAIISTLLMIAIPVLVPSSTSAVTGCAGNITSNISSGITATGPNANAGNGCNQSANGSIANIAKNIIDIFSLIVGIVSVFMIVYAGFRYITSGGDSGNTTGARNTLLYAIVGLIIVAIAQIIVRFVLHTANNISGS